MPPTNDLLDLLGLREWYPHKISYKDVVLQYKAAEEKTVKNLAWHVLHGILTVNYNAREADITSTGAANGSSELDTIDDMLTEDNQTSSLHPQDVMVILYNCSDHLLQQTLLQKMFQCRLAVPFITPNLDATPQLSLSLWAYRGIIIEWQDKQENPLQASVCDAVFTVVSFLRIGEPGLNKSQIINKFLNDGQQATFFHKDCPQGHLQRRVSGGQVEAAFRLPHGANDEVTMCINLRGDVSNHNKQLKILSQFSSVLVVFVDIKDFNQSSNNDSLSTICKSTVNVLFVVSSLAKPDTESLQEFKTRFKSLVPESSKSKVKMMSSFGPPNSVKLNKDIKENISKFESVWRSLPESRAIAKSAGVSCDEDSANCQKGQSLADIIMKQMKSRNSVANVINKSELFVLQDKIWLEWSKLEKDVYRKKDAMLLEGNKDMERLRSLRTKQLKKSQEMHEFMNTFVQTLTKECDTPVLHYFMKWLKLHLDKISREVLPPIHKEYRSTWNLLREAKEVPNEELDKAKVKDLQQKVEDIEQKLAKASIGAEHFLRELGQIYEAAIESRGTQTKHNIRSLPSLAAKLFTQGHPLEIINCASIPSTWISAVLETADEMLQGKKVIVLAILGVQSSGKSTFLNTMFGLDYAVSAGRCTKGASIQLIPVDNDDFDYIIVLDTEGLRAPELGFSKNEYDNELATMSIGISDIAMMNIKGENFSDINDILQIAVQAFLRMKLVSTKKEVQRQCLFIHQNVAAVNASVKMSEGLRELQKSLDTLTAEAAIDEGQEQIKTFSQVIDFNDAENVWYMSDLWQGDPPMAPTNPGYSGKVQDVKRNILDKLVKGRKSYTLSEVVMRVKDLWKAVLTENFVFYFRNSLAVKAYRGLESTLLELCWTYEQSLDTCMRLNALPSIKACNTEGDVDKCKEKVVRLCDTEAEKEHSAIEKQLIQYIDESRHKDIISQWEDEKRSSMRITCDDIARRIKEELMRKLDRKQMDIKQKEQQNDNERKIRNKASDLAKSLKGKNPDDVELAKKFDDLWQTVLESFGKNSARSDVDMAHCMSRILYELLFDSGRSLKEELVKDPLTTWSTGHPLSMNVAEIKPQEHIASKVAYDSQEETTKELDKMRYAALDKAKNILLECEQYCKGLSSEDTNYDTYGSSVIWIVLNNIKDINDEAADKVPFRFQRDFAVKLCTKVSRYCVARFDQMQAEFNKEHSIEGKLNKLKDQVYALFKASVESSSAEVTATNLFIIQLRGIMDEAISEYIPKQIVDEMLRSFSFSKYHLIGRLLESLAVKGKYEEFSIYIDRSAGYAKKWLEEIITEDYFGAKAMYQKLAESACKKLSERLMTMLKILSNDLEFSRKAPLSFEKWLQQLLQTQKANPASEIPISFAELKSPPGENISLEDPYHFTVVIIKEVEALVDDIMKSYNGILESKVKWHGPPPFKMVFDRIWGCVDQCYFCHEPCLMADNHSQTFHHCLQHRPQGIIGIRNSITGVIEIAQCNTLVASKATFSCQKVIPQCKAKNHTRNPDTKHLYRDYKSYMPDWDIRPDMKGDENIFWQWFVVTYCKELKRHYNYVIGKFPESWTKITRDIAISSLREYRD